MHHSRQWAEKGRRGLESRQVGMTALEQVRPRRRHPRSYRALRTSWEVVNQTEADGPHDNDGRDGDQREVSPYSLMPWPCSQSCAFTEARMSCSSV